MAMVSIEVFIFAGWWMTSPSRCSYIPGYLTYISTTKGSIVSLGTVVFQMSMTLWLKVVELQMKISKP